MGLAEVLPRLPELIRLRDRTVDAIARARPDAVVTIDSPDFTLRVAARARRARRDLPVVHYVAPSVWAWRKGRAARMAQVVDHVLALLPFEPPHMRAAGMSCDFTGHPIVSEPRAGAEEIAAIRARAGGEIALVLPGSRRGEVERLTPVLGEALARLPTGHRVVIPTLPHLAKALGAQVATWPGDPILLTDPLEKTRSLRRGEGRTRGLRLGQPGARGERYADGDRLRYELGHLAGGQPVDADRHGDPRQPRNRAKGGPGIPRSPLAVPAQ